MPGPAVEIRGPVARDRGKPSTKSRRIPKMIEPAPRGQEDVLHQIFDVGAADPGEQQPVHHPYVSLVEARERDTIAAPRPADQHGVFRSVLRAESTGHYEARADTGDIHLHGRTIFHGAC